MSNIGPTAHRKMRTGCQCSCRAHMNAVKARGGVAPSSINLRAVATQRHECAGAQADAEIFFPRGREVCACLRESDGQRFLTVDCLPDSSARSELSAWALGMVRL